jgi:hypothetical protein
MSEINIEEVESIKGCGCHRPLSQETLDLYKSKLNKFKVQNIDNTDFFSVPINFHIVADQQFLDLNLEAELRQNIVNQVEQLNLDWNGRNPDRNQTNIPQAQFWTNRGEQDKFSFYINNIRTINTDGTSANANTFIQRNGLSYDVQDVNTFGDFYRLFIYNQTQQSQNGLLDTTRTGRSETNLKVQNLTYMFFNVFGQPIFSFANGIAPSIDIDRELNVWIVPDILNLTAGGPDGTYWKGGTLGFATFPDADPADDSPLCDGIVVLMGTVGSVDAPSQMSFPASLYIDDADQLPDPANPGQTLPQSNAFSNPYRNANGNRRNAVQFQVGRTLTHEIGHYFSLRHTWGDLQPDVNGNYPCGGPFDGQDDSDRLSYPAQQGPSENRNFNAGTRVMANACAQTAPWVQNEGVMYMNYMDYFDQAHQVMFTRQQQDSLQAICVDAAQRRLMNQPDKNLKLSEQAMITPPVPLAPILNPQQGHAITAVTLGGQTPTAIMQGGTRYGNFNAPVVRAGF